MEAAGRPRRPTSDPGVYTLPGASLPAGFSDVLESGTSAEPAPARPASTILLLRDGPSAPQLLLLRRHGRSGFAAGAWVFPGGTVDAADRTGGLALLGRESAMEWARRLESPDPAEAAAYLFAALREAFEETGILLGEGATPPTSEEPRAALLGGALSFAEILEGAGASGPPTEVAYIARWITPRPEPRRYDTRFFLARVPAATEARPHRAELVEERWVTPAAALEGFADGSLPMLPPTAHTLRRLAAFADAGEALRALGEAPVPAVTPTMRSAEGGVEIVLPPEALGELPAP
jgi:8-oxo-dGTP pyrophosphatase MutT (NUDIX family)